MKYVYSNTDSQWRLRSQGQVLTGECNVQPSFLIGTTMAAGTQRWYKKDRIHIESTEQLYVRVIQTAGGSKAQLFDLYGRQLTAPVRGQLIIQNGRKMIIK